MLGLPLALSACGQPEQNVTRAEMDEIRARLTALETQAKQPPNAVVTPEPRPAAPEQPPHDASIDRHLGQWR